MRVRANAWCCCRRGTLLFIMGGSVVTGLQAEPGGYLSVCQGADGLIHLISSKQHYTFNLAWLKTPLPPPPEVPTLP